MSKASGTIAAVVLMLPGILVLIAVPGLIVAWTLWWGYDLAPASWWGAIVPVTIYMIFRAALKALVKKDED
jgi:hypothetical protein